jgi:LysR family glycine cleavage system transcriptional activator
VRTSHLNALRALEAALRTGSFRAASDELGVTTAAVGQQIRGLEDYIGRPLFDRKHSGAIPTDTAKMIAPQLTSGFGAISSVLADLQRPVSDCRLSLSMSLALAEFWLTPRLSEFYAISDQVDLRMDTTHRLINLQSEDVDFALRFGPPPAESLGSVFLFDGCIVPICTPEFASKYGLSTATTSLNGIPVLHVKKETSDPGWLNWASWCKANSIEFEDRPENPEFPRLSSGLRGAKEGLGIVLCGMVESYSSLADGSMILPFGPSSAVKTDFAYRLLSARLRPRSKMQENFRDWIGKQAETYRADVQNLLT